jgi:hypothetical protein
MAVVAPTAIAADDGSASGRLATPAERHPNVGSVAEYGIALR